MKVVLQRRIDRWLGVPLCRLLSILPRGDSRGGDRPDKILVILLSEMGSLFLLQPMLARLRANYPGAVLHALVFRRNKEVLELLEEITDDNIFAVRDDSLPAFVRDCLTAVRRMRRARIDAVIDCELFSRASAVLSFLSGARLRVGFHRHTQEGLYRGDFINRPVLYNPYQHMAHQFLNLVEAIEGSGTPTVKRSVEGDALVLRPLKLRESELEAMRNRFEGDFPAVKANRPVLLYPGGGLLPIRAWPLESYQALARGLIDEGHMVGVIGLAQDRELARAIQSACGSENVLDLTGYTRTVRELMLLFHFCPLLVTNDGGPGHFAARTPIRSIVLYGPETPTLYGTLDPDAVHLYTALSCSPCLTAYNHRSSPCDGDNQCLKQISPGEVLRKALEMLSAPPRQ